MFKEKKNIYIYIYMKLKESLTYRFYKIDDRCFAFHIFVFQPRLFRDKGP